MKFKLLVASLALFASSAQANIISTDVYIDTDNRVEYVNFDVTNAGDFLIISDDNTFLNTFPFILDNSRLNPHAMLFSSPLSSLNYIAQNDNFIFDDSWILEDLQIGSYILALSDSILTKDEAIGGYNNDDFSSKTKGNINVTIKSVNGTAEFSNPSAVPVPAAAWLLGSALLGFVGFRRKSV
jgi:hypothetical protein